MLVQIFKSLTAASVFLLSCNNILHFKNPEMFTARDSA